MKRISDKTKKQLIHLYTQTNTSVVVISSVLDISIKTIYKILDENNIERRAKKEYDLALIGWELPAIPDATEIIRYSGYEDEKLNSYLQSLVVSTNKNNTESNVVDDVTDTGRDAVNDVYEMLGIEKTKAGQIVGWVYDRENPNGDNFVDFGIYGMSKERVRAFVNGYETNILLDFNVDGNIWDLM